jgi:hypothetical protein
MIKEPVEVKEESADAVRVVTVAAPKVVLPDTVRFVDTD